MSSLKPEAAASLEPADPIFRNWKLECEAVHEEMDCLLKAGWAETAADRQVRRMQFMALIERRNAAARNLLLRTDIDGMSPAGLRGALEQAPVARSDAAEGYVRQVPPSSDPNPELPAPPSPEQAPSASPGSEPMSDIRCLNFLMSLEP
jgi:hypothetical protein